VIRAHGAIALRPDVFAILESAEAHQEKSQTQGGSGRRLSNLKRREGRMPVTRR
jgi:hypothetical protein